MEAKGRSNKFLYILLTTLIVLVIAGLTTGLVIYFKSSDSDAEVKQDQPKEKKSILWGYRCEDNRCVKFKLTSENNNTALGLSSCRLFCNQDIGTLWPKPSGNVQVTKETTQINPDEIEFKTNNFKKEPEYWEMAKERFQEMQDKKKPKKFQLENGGSLLVVEVEAETDEMVFDYTTEESYKLIIKKSSNTITASIKAPNFYGARHALETLSQLIIYDEVKNDIEIVSGCDITDEPKFKHRGISLDTSRNFYPVDVLKRTINGLAMVKLNTFHWHISDSQSFPLLLKSHPEIALNSIYSMDKVYSTEDVVEIVKYAKARGVRVIPEIDIPGHVGEGWFKANLTSCYSSKPAEPCKGAHPCGQLDPSKDEVYQVLTDVYREIVEYFEFPEIIHMGNDEVFVECWNASASLQNWMVNTKNWGLTNDDFMKLWGYFLENALKSLDSVHKKKVPVVLWTSTLTQEPFLSTYLNKDRFIVQVWTKGNDAEVKNLLEKGYKLIISNYDALYLDCGFGSWVRDGLNWCAPYIGWQKVYDNKMEAIGGEFIDQIQGAEAALWSEQVDEFSIDARLWPRVSALAERLWSNPETFFRDAESRMLMHRQTLVEIGGLRAEKLQPEWCLQNEGVCPM